MMHNLNVEIIEFLSNNFNYKISHFNYKLIKKKKQKNEEDKQGWKQRTEKEVFSSLYRYPFK